MIFAWKFSQVRRCQFEQAASDPTSPLSWSRWLWNGPDWRPYGNMLTNHFLCRSYLVKRNYSPRFDKDEPLAEPLDSDESGSGFPTKPTNLPLTQSSNITFRKFSLSTNRLIVLYCVLQMRSIPIERNRFLKLPFEAWYKSRDFSRWQFHFHHYCFPNGVPYIREAPQINCFRYLA